MVTACRPVVSPAAANAAADRAMLNALQRDFPLLDDPWPVLAERVACSEAVLLQRLQHWRDQGAILRVGPVFTPNRVGASCLAAFAVDAADLDRAVARVNQHPGVNHNYLREHRYNLWFVMHARDAVEREQALDQLAADIGAPLIRLPMTHAFHLDLGFDLFTGERHRHAAESPAEPVALTDVQMRQVARLQQGLPLCADPWRRLCEGDETEARALLAQTKAWLEQGVIRRFGVIVAHRQQGYTANAMVVWDVPDADVDRAGEWLAARDGVHLCYARQRQRPEWPYNLFCMIHGRTRAETDARIADLNRDAPFSASGHAVLYSTQAFKQEGARNHHANIAGTLASEQFTGPDAALFNRLQRGIPLVARPFAQVADELGCGWTDDAIRARIEDWLARGVLTRFGPLFQIERRGGAFTLCALHAPAEQFDRIAAVVNGQDAVAHNYARDHHFNMWFVLATERAGDTPDVLDALEQACGTRILAFPKTHEFAVGLYLPVGEGAGRAGVLRPVSEDYGCPSPAPSAERIRALVVGSARGLPLAERPFAELASQCGLDEDTVLAMFRWMQRDGSVRRIAAIPDHYRIGYRCNVMTVWDVADADAREAGEAVAAMPFVSHCYLRPRHLPDWPYNLFAMVHAQTSEDAMRQVQQIHDALGARCRAHDALVSTRILKKTGLRLSPQAGDRSPDTTEKP